MVKAATNISYQRLLAVEPALVAIAPLASLRSADRLPPKTLLHAGPPFAGLRSPPAPILNAALAAARLEGWVSTKAEAHDAIADGRIKLAPAQDHDVVTPLAFVVGPSTMCLKVEDLARRGCAKFSPLNDGPPATGLRFGTGCDAGLAIISALTERIGPELAHALKAPQPLLPAIARALAGGDELHGSVATLQSEVLAMLGNQHSTETAEYLASVGQFALNVMMATAALMIEAGAGVADSEMVVASGGNGRDLGYKIARDPSTWIIRPAHRPIGPRLPGVDKTAQPSPALGDSAVIDALGFGAACIRYCPDIRSALQSHIDRDEISSDYLSDKAHAAFLGPHPALGNDAIRVGLDLTRPRSCLGIMLGMVEEAGIHGLIGRGISSWPEG